MRRTSALAALLAITAFCSTAIPAQAAKVAWQDCRANGGDSLSGHYTIAQLNTALRTMPSYVEEYSNCYGVIQAQLLKQQLREKPRPKAYASAAGGSSGGGSTPLIVAIAVVAVGGMGFAFWASRRRRGGSPPADGPPVG